MIKPPTQFLVPARRVTAAQLFTATEAPVAACSHVLGFKTSGSPAVLFTAVRDYIQG